MTTTIENYRKSAEITQQQLAGMLHTDKSNISHIESGRRHMTATMYAAAFNNVPDATALTNFAHEITQGYTMPSASNHVWDDHRMSIAHRLVREIKEAKEVLANHILDKQPQHLNSDDKESIFNFFAEIQDVVFEGQCMLNRLSSDYDFLLPQQMNQNRDARLKMERRI